MRAPAFRGHTWRWANACWNLKADTGISMASPPTITWPRPKSCFGRWTSNGTWSNWNGCGREDRFRGRRPLRYWTEKQDSCFSQAASSIWKDPFAGSQGLLTRGLCEPVSLLPEERPPQSRHRSGTIASFHSLCRSLARSLSSLLTAHPAPRPRKASIGFSCTGTT